MPCATLGALTVQTQYRCYERSLKRTRQHCDARSRGRRACLCRPQPDFESDPRLIDLVVIVGGFEFDTATNLHAVVELAAHVEVNFGVLSSHHTVIVITTLLLFIIKVQVEIITATEADIEGAGLRPARSLLPTLSCVAATKLVVPRRNFLFISIPLIIDRYF